MAVRARRHQRRDDGGAQCLPGFRIAEESRDIDHEVVGERKNLVPILAQDARVFAQRIGEGEAHAPLDPPQQRGLAVAVEIVTRAHAQDGEHFTQMCVIALQRFLRIEVLVRVRRVYVSLKYGVDFLRRQHLIGVPGLDQALRHSREPGIFRILRDADAAGRLDGLTTRGAVGAGTREDDGDRFFPLLRRERPEEVVDRPAMPALLHRFAEMQLAFGQGQRVPGRDDVDAIDLDRDAIGDFLHRQPRVPRQNGVEHAGVVGRQMHDDHEGHAAIGRHIREEGFERLDAAGGCANTHDGKGKRGLGDKIDGCIDAGIVPLGGHVAAAFRGIFFGHPPPRAIVAAALTARVVTMP
jgi:hypothetical protein